MPSTQRKVVPPSEINPGDKVILVMGSTGSGMSHFINILTGMPEEPDAGKFDSCTRDVLAYSYGHQSGRFILVDTPGFDSTHYSSSYAVLEVVPKWLEQ
ncbi:hypothetical protein ID866_8504 [Astraeus odoratus]|nr:hypothetical protein ID866_8504 [Astraeus odoratus]